MSCQIWAHLPLFQIQKHEAHQLICSTQVGGFKRRLTIVRQSLPHAKLGLYGTTVHDSCKGVVPDDECTALRLKGYQRASAYGLFDDIDILVPVLYLGPNIDRHDGNTTFTRLNTASQVKRKDGSTLPMWPVLRYAWFGGHKSNWPATHQQMQHQIDVVQNWDGGAGQSEIGGLLYWNGHDNSSELEWFHVNDPVAYAGCPRQR